ncbi:hypothetical protein QO259_17230 [Salinicola sp. JS01]|uniref:hypothetical protein n=1 Tax=Salinicola sp. JS01 TaxID=3050071 RepID=UPI00255C12FF|nr:hypothetical protein [Salinicola sp. JS01]WIX32531.1 hypothetical protein QO259_17230 [Salinicola sp. JS01]
MDDVLTLRPMGNGLWMEDADSSQSQQYVLKQQASLSMMALIEEEMIRHESELSEQIAQIFEARPGPYTGAQVAKLLRDTARDVCRAPRQAEGGQD